MNKDIIIYRTNTVSESILLDYLNLFSTEPLIPLSQRVNIEEYVHKMKQSGTSFEAWSRNDLIGILVAYINDYINKRAFITYFRVKPEYRGCGIGKKLLNDLFSACQQAHFNTIGLEVDMDNTKALNLYQARGFSIILKKENSFLMSKAVH